MGEGRPRGGNCPEVTRVFSFYGSGGLGSWTGQHRTGSSPSSGGLHTRVERGSFDPTMFVLRVLTAWSHGGGGDKHTVLCHLGGDPRQELKRRAVFTPVALGGSAPGIGSHRAGIRLLGVPICCCPCLWLLSNQLPTLSRSRCGLLLLSPHLP